MIRNFILFLSFSVLYVTGCRRGDHFISDPDYRKKVESQFRKQKSLAKNRSEKLFHVFDGDLPLDEEEALKFLFAYMPLSDLADYDGEFYLKNIRSSLAARDTFSWGRTIPEGIFRHFVLPVRVNNENLDSSRWIFFAELKDRVKNLTLKEAVLEVNHWCHEKVTYRATDIRTSSPLATVQVGFGRCGEESTFTVAALRSVGIPARQCYTPRWAHCDDNHAWVEVWVDGKWHFIGACEPEPDLDMAWFTTPARRAMLVNTNVFGDYEGPEDVLVKDDRYTRINILSNYAPVKRIVVHVTNADHKPADSAIVEFQLYNYAEFFPLHRTATDPQGFCSFTTGMGDLVVWASQEGLFDYRKITVGDTDTLDLSLTLKPGREYTESLDLVPPPPAVPLATISDSLRALNNKRLAFEDEIRSAYERTFIDSVMAFRLAGSLGLNRDTLWQYLRRSGGHWREMTGFITSVPAGERRWIFPLLSVLSEKDLRDADPLALQDHLEHFGRFEPLTTNKDFIYGYILNPRIDNEALRGWRADLQAGFDTGFIRQCRKDPAMIDGWITSHITTDPAANYGRAPLTPAGVFELRVTDPHSRNILFVAICRSFGIPSRLEPATKVPQYCTGDTWTDVVPDTSVTATGKGQILLTRDPSRETQPVYYTHFTLGQFRDGFFRSLDYEYDPVFKIFPAKVTVNPGNYLLVTGNRMQDGVVLASLCFFRLEKGATVSRVLTMRKDPAPAISLGKFDRKSFFSGLGQGRSAIQDPGKPLILAWLEPDREPTKHFVADLKQQKKILENSRTDILLLFRNETERDLFRLKTARELPLKTRYLVTDPATLDGIGKAANRSLGQGFPVVCLLSPEGDIRFISEGYRIGTGDELVKLLK